MEFTGFFPETYQFLLSVAFNNDKAWFREHKEEFQTYVQAPLLALERLLAPVALKLDPNFRTGRWAVSRIYRDTRFSKNKDPLRDHMWIGYREPQERNSECFGLYFEITPVSFGFGMGMYAPNAERMEAVRGRALARPARLEALLKAPDMERFTLEGESYVRPRVKDAPEALLPLLNKKYFSFDYEDGDTARTFRPEFANEVAEGFLTLMPLYRFLKGQDMP